MSNQNLDDILKANPNAPTNDEYALNFARKILPPRDQRIEQPLDFSFAEGPIAFTAREKERFDWCGEYTRGLLEAVLASTLISSEAKTKIEAMMADSMPTLEREKTIGHFHFMWTETSTDSRDNVTEADIDATGTVLNDCWNRYSTDFLQPKADLIDGQRIIDVEVYYDPFFLGWTASPINKITLNSHYVVRETCHRQTTSAHELFHRVQYAYGYVTGTASQRWWVEGTASWSQDYAYDGINDYVNRVNSGLDSPDTSLLNRSYDACHYWKYFCEQVYKRSSRSGNGGEVAGITSEQHALREFLEEYSVNGLDAKAASGTVTQNWILRSFDQFFCDWSKANYIKDLGNPYVRYEYDEDEDVTISCGVTYGPYRHVAQVVDQSITSDTYSWTSPTYVVNSYGTDYLLFRIKATVGRIGIRFEGNPNGGNGQFCLHLVMIKDGRWKKIYNNYSSVTERTWDMSFSPGEYDRCVLVVNGLVTTGDYKISINACVSGVWRDSYTNVWTLVQAGNDITGTIRTRICGTYRAKGTLRGNNITLKATGRCCDFELKGKVVDCKSASGTWTNDCGGKGLWSAKKTDAAEALATLELEEIEMADDPATMRG